MGSTATGSVVVSGLTAYTDANIGLASIVSDVLRSGGSEKLPGDELDEWLDRIDDWRFRRR